MPNIRMWFVMNLRAISAGTAILLAALMSSLLRQHIESELCSLGYQKPDSTSPYTDPAPIKSQDSDFAIRRYDLDLHIDPLKRRIFGRARLNVLIVAEELRSLSLNMADRLAVISVHSHNNRLHFVHRDDHLEISFERPCNANSELEVTIDYEGSPAGRGLIFDEHNSIPMIYSYGLPFTAQHWFPCKDAPADKADSADIAITVPASLIAASNGRLARTTTNSDGTTTYYWEVRYPIYPDVISVAVTNYATFTLPYHYRQSEVMLMPFYVYPEDLEKARKQFAVLPEMMKHHEAAFGEYPFLKEKYGVAEFAKPSFREHQTLPSFAAKLITGDHENDWILAHELAHQWFGNCVSVKAWSHIWLNEGFANYAYALWKEKTEGDEAYRDLMQSWDKDEFPGSVFITDPTNKDALFSETTFQKGAWILHMLRHVMGDQTFFDALKSYVKTYAYRSADTEDFEAVCESKVGRSLNWFFKEWVYGINRPAYECTWRTQRTGDDTVVTVEIIQGQTNSQIFEMPIDISIVTDKGRAKFIAWQKLRSQTFEFRVPGQAEGVELDPDGWILKKLKQPNQVRSGAENLCPTISTNP